ncbi:conserved hypothetical protein [Methylocella silvestris BL2]|uniref:DUF2946 domain-containing protein n=1 Tax=Methylocella silvestris (strain DSM 15510 / CIP 108128 / LMG 27833 / NCIMB 13906 / BL2) TaxID=395965 RepID=B8EJN5_METSB|nr:hypothetical protein [Methylocella silvestris]ACK49439.1 conserved hypothetical protein [Methylocella silvestris BL2]
MTRPARWFRNVAMAAACAAAYALVLQIMLTSALAASLPVDRSVGGSLPLCGKFSGDKGAPAKGHCPLCCCRADAPPPPLPPATPVIDRFAIELHFETALRVGAACSAQRSPGQPRGPPGLA